MPKRILVIDDDEHVSSYLSDLLEDAGYETDVAANGQQALTLLEKKRFDLMTLDLEMPDMTGPKFNKVLKKQGRSGDIPIVVITGHMGLKYVIPNAVAEFDKPIDREALLAKVKEILG
jgi:CheY-like chemotaxis protein